MSIDWRVLKSPSLAEFEDIAHEAYQRLPQRFRDLCDGVIIRVDDFPDEETLTIMEAETPFDLLGLFTGVGLAHAGAAFETGQFPNMVFLYRRPILDYWSEHEETLGHVITHVLVHEIGHHFGLSDEDMDAIERDAG
jgi:predicted Zn-dependent protease with MMP-like domain